MATSESHERHQKTYRKLSNYEAMSNPNLMTLEQERKARLFQFSEPYALKVLRKEREKKNGNN